MERLTFEGLFCDIAMCQNTPGGTFCETGMCSQRKVWERLKEWEDTGLDLEDLHLNVDIDYCRLIELLKADAEDRLVVLPCKVGDTVWLLYGENVVEAKVDLIRPFVREGNIEFRGNAVWSHEDPFWDDGRIIHQELFIVFGRDAFLTREEAEAALKGGGGDG